MELKKINYVTVNYHRSHLLLKAFLVMKVIHTSSMSERKSTTHVAREYTPSIENNFINRMIYAIHGCLYNYNPLLRYYDQSYTFATYTYIR